MLTIGDKIKAIRKERGLTQKEFAKKINKSERMIQKYENSEVEPRIEVLRDISLALDISFSELINPRNIPININESIDKFKNEYVDFIIDFEQLNDEGKNKVITYTKDLVDNPKFINQPIQKQSEDEISATSIDDFEPYLLAAHSDGIDEETNKANIEKIKKMYLELKGK